MEKELPMTPDTMLAAWDALIAQGHSVTMEPPESSPGCYCCIDLIDPEYGDTYARFEARGAGPLKAFEAAYQEYRGYQERSEEMDREQEPK